MMKRRSDVIRPPRIDVQKSGGWTGFPPRLLILFILLLLVFPASAQEERTVGVLVNTEAAYEGYTLFSPMNTPSVYLMDNEGRIIHTWEIENTEAVMEAHLRENGNLVVVAKPRDAAPSSTRQDGSIREYTWDNQFVWEYHHQFAVRGLNQHHAIDILPNGNILAIARKRRPINEALAMGLKPAFSAMLQKQPLLVDIIVEIDPLTNEIVWQWDPWDHLAQGLDADLPNYGEISQRPRRIDINYQPRLIEYMKPDWLHVNSVHYHPELDQIVISSRHLNELWIIDHSASTTEATGPAGDLLWRWGNPAAYQQGDPVDDRQLFRQHDAQWIADGLPGAGNILIFNNQNIGADGEKYSSALELKPPLRPDGSYDWEREAEIVWSYTSDGFFYSVTLSGAQRLPNGNTLITEGRHGRLIEVSAGGETVWEFVNPASRRGLIKQGDPPNPSGIHFSQRNTLFRVRKYPLDHPAFAGRDMTPGERLAH